MTVARAPGRVNLIGDHTDYNGGFVLPIAIDLCTTVTAAPRHDTVVTVEASDLPDSDRFDLDDIQRTGTWRDYVRGIVKALAPEHGVDLHIKSNLPRGAGLSSSAALEIAVARSLSDLPLVELAVLCQRMENEFVGVRCGIMDQLVVAVAKGNHALLLDCQDLTYRHVPIPANAGIVICDSQMERRLASSGYNERRAACEQAATLIGVTTLRHATLEQVEQLPPPLHRRALHVVTENERTLAAASALDSGDLVALGDLMNDSHASMRDCFEIVPSEIDDLVSAVRQVPGCYGARLTGGGFGGATVNLVRPDAIDLVRAEAESLGAIVHICHAAEAVRRTS